MANRRQNDRQVTPGGWASLNLDDVLAEFERRWSAQIVAKSILPERPGSFGPYPQSLHESLRQYLQSHSIAQLYEHQNQSFEAISANRPTVIVSRTAGGKTLSFLLPIVNEYLNSGGAFSTMLLFPTKALSRDQESTLFQLLHHVSLKGRVGTYDGDTPREERLRIRRRCDFVITNPDMLHAAVLPYHARIWKDFLARLRYIVIDEVHTYRGAFGSHVSNVFRRLKRAAAMAGGKPNFVCCSATIGNPKDHAESLCGEQFSLISSDGSPSPPRSLYLVNPPLITSAGLSPYRKSPASVAGPLIRMAAKHQVRTICFCRSRQGVERLRRRVIDRSPHLARSVKPYRGGLLPQERRALERDLFEGRTQAVITTNALELGIDIGNLELCILNGFPGSIASFWQRAGRVGRKGNHAAIVFIARDLPIDQFLIQHPDYLIGAPIEQARLDQDNPYVLLQHLPCAAYEHPLRPQEDFFQTSIYHSACETLVEQKVLAPYRGALRFALHDYPSKGVNLRGMTDYNVEIYCGSEVIGELDPIGARGTLYKDAIYQHLGERYISRELDLEKKLCRVESVDVDYYTEAVWEGYVRLVEEDGRKTIFESQLRFGPAHVFRQPKMYKKIRERTFENIGYGPITLPPFEYDTYGLALLVADRWLHPIRDIDPRLEGAAHYGLAYILRHLVPIWAMCDEGDIETAVDLEENDQSPTDDRTDWLAGLYLYDRIEGGVGFSEIAFENFSSLMEMAVKLVGECSCQFGCPACVPPLPPGVIDDHLMELLIVTNSAKEATRSLLHFLVCGEYSAPEILTEEAALRPRPSEGDDGELQARTKRKLARAAATQQKKRDRQH